MSTTNWWGDWRPNLTPHTGNLLATDLIECTMIVGGLPVNTVITGAQILGAVPSGGGLDIGTSPITSGTIGRVLFQGTGNVLQQSANLFWDNTNSRLGIGTASPNMVLDIRTGNVGIGVTSDAGFKLDVNGTARVQNAFTANGKIFAYGNSTTGISGLGPGLVVEYNLGRGRLFSYDYGAGVSSPISIGENSSRVYIGAYNAAYTSSINIIGSTTIDGDINFIKSTGNILHQYNTGGSIKFILGINSTLNGYQIFNNTTSNRPIFLPQVSGNVIINGTTDITSAQLQITSTTKGFLPPRMTTAQKNAIASPAAGLVVYDTTLNKLCVRTASAWETITSV